PSVEVGGEVRRKRALNCWPWVRSLTHSAEAVIHSPAAMVAAWPTPGKKARVPRALGGETPKPFSAVGEVTRHRRPAKTSWFDGSGCGFMSFEPCIRLSYGRIAPPGFSPFFGSLESPL